MPTKVDICEHKAGEWRWRALLDGEIIADREGFPSEKEAEVNLDRLYDVLRAYHWRSGRLRTRW